MPAEFIKAILICLGITVLLAIRFHFFARRSRQPPPWVGKKMPPITHSRPNFVSSFTNNPKRSIEPIPIAGDEWNIAASAVARMTRASIIEKDSHYLHAEFRSSLFGFVDDLELRLDEDQNRIDIRSASRVGHSDLSANAKRVALLKKRIAESKKRSDD